MKNDAIKSVFYDDPAVLRFLEMREKAALLDTIVERMEAIQGPPGNTPTTEELIALIRPLIPAPVKGDQGESIKGDQGPQGIRGPQGEPGRTGKPGESIKGDKGDPGKDAEFDSKDLFDTFIKRIQKEQLLDISHIRNASSFMKDGIKYKIEELMHGGASSTGAGLSVLTTTGTVDDSNVTFPFTSAPTLVVVNGVSYRNGHGVTISGTTAVLDTPAGVGGDVYGLGT